MKKYLILTAIIAFALSTTAYASNTYDTDNSTTNNIFQGSYKGNGLYSQRDDYENNTEDQLKTKTENEKNSLNSKKKHRKMGKDKKNNQDSTTQEQSSDKKNDKSYQDKINAQKHYQQLNKQKMSDYAKTGMYYRKNGYGTYDHLTPNEYHKKNKKFF